MEVVFCQVTPLTLIYQHMYFCHIYFSQLTTVIAIYDHDFFILDDSASAILWGRDMRSHNPRERNSTHLCLKLTVLNCSVFSLVNLWKSVKLQMPEIWHENITLWNNLSSHAVYFENEVVWPADYSILWFFAEFCMF